MEVKQYNDTRYSISDTGIVFTSTGGGKPLNQWLANTGYMKCRFQIDGVKKDKYVHRLVAEMFIPNPDNLPQVMHIDGDKTNNNVTNLMWGSNAQNTQDGYDSGAYLFKARSYRVIATDINSGEEIHFKSVRELESVLGYNRKTVASILKGEKKVNNYQHTFRYDM